MANNNFNSPGNMMGHMTVERCVSKISGKYRK